MADVTKRAPRGLVIERDIMGTIHIKSGDFDYIQIRYRYPDTDNSGTRRLAEQIVALLEGDNEVERLRGLFTYWKQRAKSAEGHLFAGDVRSAARALHAITPQASTPFEELSEPDRQARLRGAWTVVASINAARLLRLPHDSRVDHVWCACGDGYPNDSYGAGFMAAAGECENCAAAATTKENGAG